MSCSNCRKPVLAHIDRGALALRYAWLRAPPPLHQAQPKPGPSKLDASPHMRVGKARVARVIRVGKIVRAPCPRGKDGAEILPTLRRYDEMTTRQ